MPTHYPGMGESTPKNDGENPAKKRRKPLTPRELKFCHHYAANDNATEAYYYAYGRWTTKDGKRVPKSYKYASRRASRLRKRDDIRAEIRRCVKAITKTVRMDRTKYLKLLGFLVGQDEADLYTTDPETGLPKPKKWSHLTPSQRKLVKAAKCKIRRVRGKGGLIEEVENAEYVTHDRMKAMELLGKASGLLAEPQPLDQLLALLPPAAAEVIRRAIAEAMVGGGQAGSGSQGGPGGGA